MGEFSYFITKVDLKYGLERPIYYAIYIHERLGLYHFTVLSLMDNARQR